MGLKGGGGMSSAGPGVVENGTGKAVVGLPSAWAPDAPSRHSTSPSNAPCTKF